ncbi:MAG: DNA methyltransferase [Candidatus Woesearchaeota archaeon]
MHLILLSGENLRLARLEAESLLKLEQTNLVGNRLYCTIPTESLKLIDRLAYTRKIYEIIYFTDKKNLEISLKSYPWINYYEKNFCVRITSDEHYDERYYAGFVWQSLEKNTRPKVDLDNPNLLIEIFIDKNKTTVTRLLYHNFETFENRKAHLRPVLHPTAMHPKMARALINILNPSQKDKVIDPFCGACGILTEAGLLGLKFEGYDIDKKILDDASKNLEYYDIRPEHYTLIVRDSTKIKNLKNIVTDLPYGKSSKKSHELIELYSRFLKNVSGRAVIVMPNFMPYKNLLEKNLPKSVMVTHIIDQYVHKSLTRKIVVINKKVAKKLNFKNIAKKIPTKKVSIKISKKSKKIVKRKLKNIKRVVKKEISSKRYYKKNNAYKKFKRKTLKKIGR